MKSILVFLIIISLLLIFLPLETQAITFSNPVSSLAGKSVHQIVGKVIQTILGIIGSIALVLFIAAGFIWMTAKGDSGKIKKATDMMLWAAIGLIVVFSSYAILSFVFGILKK